MDCAAAAASLKKLLVAHGNAEAQVSALDDQIHSVGQQTLVSALDGNMSQDLHLSLRLSVCEGVRSMYQNYQNKNWSQVQQTARDIIQTLEDDLDAEQMTSPLISSSPSSRGNANVDKAANKWTTAFCKFYRNS